MQLEGSCHCRAVRFTLESTHYYPFNVCYCSICRKTTGGGGYAINLGGDADTLRVEGEAHLRIYQARMDAGRSDDPERSPRRERHFCGLCGSHLWLWDPRWPELVHPLAAAIDTDLPVPPERTHLMTNSRASWVEVRAAESDRVHGEYPEESIASWHARVLASTDPQALKRACTIDSCSKTRGHPPTRMRVMRRRRNP